MNHESKARQRAFSLNASREPCLGFHLDIFSRVHANANFFGTSGKSFFEIDGLLVRSLLITSSALSLLRADQLCSLERGGLLDDSDERIKREINGRRSKCFLLLGQGSIVMSRRSSEISISRSVRIKLSPLPRSSGTISLCLTQTLHVPLIVSRGSSISHWPLFSARGRQPAKIVFPLIELRSTTSRSDVVDCLDFDHDFAGVKSGANFSNFHPHHCPPLVCRGRSLPDSTSWVNPPERVFPDDLG